MNELITQEYLAKFREDARGIVKAMYKDENGNPFVLTDGQCDIFNLIFKKLTPRVHIASFTRYGKSHTIAMAILTRICTYPERWCIAAGNEDQAHIILSHLISHIFDNELTRRRFILGRGESEESIRRYRNKNRLNFKLEKGLLGEVFVTNAQGAMGYGAPNVILDEAALVTDQDESFVFRMLGDQTDNFYFKIGNPWDSGHFRSSASDPNYFKVNIDYYQGIKENRIKPEMVEEARKKPFFGVLYECKFPPLSAQNEEGWIPLLTKDEVERAFIYQWASYGEERLGGDVAGGGKNSSVLVHRSPLAARIMLKSNEADTMLFAEQVMSFQKKLKIRNENLFIDKVGIGRGVCDILARQSGYNNGINVGDKLTEGTKDEELYFNLRAKIGWKLRQWILGGGKLMVENDQQKEDWLQLSKVKYRQRLEGMHGKIQIMPKEKMLKEGIESPDCYDALALTFVTDDREYTDMEEEFMERQQKEISFMQPNQ